MSYNYLCALDQTYCLVSLVLTNLINHFTAGIILDDEVYEVCDLTPTTARRLNKFTPEVFVYMAM